MFELIKYFSFRDIEQELIPALRRFGIRFYVYNPVSSEIDNMRFWSRD